MHTNPSAEQTGGEYALTEQLLSKGQATPLHSRPEDAETFCVLEGEVTFYLEDGQLLAASSGAVVHVPKGAARAYRADSESARVLNITTPQHESFFRAAGEPAQARTLPPQAPRHGQGHGRGERTRGGDSRPPLGIEA
ncbi:MAG TPA: cupin domain-containing protein [Rubrobacter sp.]|nr:cupin domain-containing protein [Rubrobacter sp.]